MFLQPKIVEKGIFFKTITLAKTAYQQQIGIANDACIELLLPPVALFASSFALRASVVSLLRMDKRTDSKSVVGILLSFFFSRSDGHVHR